MAVGFRGEDRVTESQLMIQIGHQPRGPAIPGVIDQNMVRPAQEPLIRTCRSERICQTGIPGRGACVDENKIVSRDLQKVLRRHGLGNRLSAGGVRSGEQEMTVVDSRICVKAIAEHSRVSVRRDGKRGPVWQLRQDIRFHHRL